MAIGLVTELNIPNAKRGPNFVPSIHPFLI